MDDEKQAPAPPPDRPPDAVPATPEPALPEPPPGAGPFARSPEVAPPSPPEWTTETTPTPEWRGQAARGPEWSPWPYPEWPGPVSPSFLWGALVLGVVGALALVFGLPDTGFLLAMAAVFYLAQAADVHPAVARVYRFLAWIPSVLGAGALLGIAAILGPAPHTPLRLGFTVLSLAGVCASLALLVPRVADAVARVLLRERSPGHVARLAATSVLITLWASVPAWLALRGTIAELLREPEAIASPARLGGSLVAYVALAFAGVGYGVRRSGRATLERLGLTRLRVSDAVTIAIGLVVLWLFNAGSEAVERTWFPALWRVDQRFTESIAGVMAPAVMVLLGISAGVGEEITLRGALQPRLGLWLTALLFALLHVQYSWFGMASILVFGLILGAVRLRSGTTSAILVHALYDALALAAAKHA